MSERMSFADVVMEQLSMAYASQLMIAIRAVFPSKETR
jgi:hypothetical protein